MPEKNQDHTITVSTGTILRVLVLFLFIWFLYVVRDAVLLVILSVVLAAALDPFVNDLEKVYIPRWAGVLFIYVLALGLVAGSVYLVVPPFVEQVQNISHNLPEFTKNLSDKLLAVQSSYGEQFIPADSISKIIGVVSEKIGGIGGNVVSVASTFFGAVVTLIFVFVLTFYLLVERDALKTFVADIVPKQYEDTFVNATREVKSRIGRWFKGQLFLSLAIFVLTLVALEVLGVKYALTFALIAGITEIVPYLGPVLGAIPAVLITLLIDPFKALLVFIVYIVVQQLENHLIVPKVMARSVGLNPVIIVIAIMLGVRLAGIPGIVLAIPMAIVATVIIKGSLSQPASLHSHKE